VSCLNHDPRKLMCSMDKNSLFLHPVSRHEVPDYFDVIKEPMCWSFIDDKLEKNAYKRVEDFTVSLSQCGFVQLLMAAGYLACAGQRDAIQQAGYNFQPYRQAD
jgi:hypothetical protein